MDLIPSRHRHPCIILVLLAAGVFSVSQLAAQTIPNPRLHTPSRVLEAVSDTHRHTLRGNTHPLARPEFDTGALPDTTPLHRILLLLDRSPEQATALNQLLEQQADPTSPNFHRWLTPTDLGNLFGPSDHDVEAVTAWLTASGFTGISVNAARTLVEFSGTVATVRSALHTSMRRYTVHGTEHTANAADPEIPSALAPVIAGIASLNNFHRHSLSRSAGNFRHNTRTHATTRLTPQSQTAATPDLTITNTNGTLYGVTPFDFATIYNLLPLWSSATPIDGDGQTVAIVGETDINPADFVSFRKLFNLPIGSTATPTGTQYLNIIYNGPNPGILDGEEGEADIDTQWSAAVAKRATIDLVVSESTETTQGTDLSAAYIVDNNLAPVLSYSYGECEADLGASGNAFFNRLWQQAAAQGITVVVASGDSGSAGCDVSNTLGARSGLAVNGLASTPFNVAVGGTDFDLISNNPDTFWSRSSDPVTDASALSYIPETTWNETCTNTLLAQTSFFYNQSPAQVCTSSRALRDNLLDLGGGGGGPSTCAQTSRDLTSRDLTVSGGVTCTGYPKPAWQTGAGVPLDNARDTPDVSLFASSGFFGAFYVVCQQSANTDGQPCSLSAPTYDFAGYGGTSVAAPAFAGILSLVNQKTGSRQGNANYTLYALSHAQTSAGTSCNASSGSSPAGCVFNDITAGTITQPCLARSPDCTLPHPLGRYGILSGYPTTPGYDLATGLGSVNAANLVNAWASATATTPTVSALTLSPTTLVHGATVTGTVQVTSGSGTPTGDVSVIASAANVVTSGSLSAGVFSAPIATTLPGGTYSMESHYAGDGIFAGSDSPPVTLTVTPESSTITLLPQINSPLTGAVVPITSPATFPYGALYLLRATAAGLSGKGVPTGNILLTDTGLPIDGGTLRLNSAGYTEDATTTLAPGTHTLSAAFSGDPSFSESHSAPFTLTITKAPTTSTLSGTTTDVSSTDSFTVSAQVAAGGFDPPGNHGYGALAPSGLLTLMEGSTLIASAPLNPQAYPATISDSSSASFYVNGSQLPAGTSTLTVIYPGDANYLPSVSTSVPITVTASPLASTTTRLNLTPSTVVQGDPVTLSAAITPSTSTGTVRLSLDGNLYGAPVTLTSGTAILPLITGTLQIGTHTLDAIYSGSNLAQPSTSTPVNLTITAPAGSFTLTPSVIATTLHRGTPNTLTLVATPLDGFNATLSIACTSGLPARASCAFSPAAFTVAGSPASTTLTLTAEAPSTSAALAPPRSAPWLPFGTGLTSAGLLSLCAPIRRRRLPTRFLALIAAALSAAVLSATTGCGTSGTIAAASTTIPTTPTGGTPIGNYTITITATAGSVLRTATINLAVQ